MTRNSLRKALTIARTVLAVTRPELRVVAIAALLVISFVTRSTAAVALHPRAHFATMLAYSVTTSVARPVTFDTARMDTQTMAAGASGVAKSAALDDYQQPITVRPVRILTEVRTRREIVRPAADIRFSMRLAANQRKVLRPERDGIRVATERLTTWDDVVVSRQLLTRAVVATARPAIIVQGAPRSIAQIPASIKFRRLAAIFTMVATAYTAGSASPWGTGYTATGMLARYGVVAVDPHIIPLGTHLFIPGYGYAIAGDTGGAIIGHRVDLCMDSLADALNFGRHMITVYILKR